MILFAMLVAGVLTQRQPSTESVLLSGNGTTNVVAAVANTSVVKHKVHVFDY